MRTWPAMKRVVVITSTIVVKGISKRHLYIVRTQTAFWYISCLGHIRLIAINAGI